VIANILLLLLAILILATQYETLAAIHLRGWSGMSLLLLASLALGWLCGGKDRTVRIALALTTASRNIAVGLVIVTSNFPATPAVTAVVAFGLLSIFGTLVCAWLCRKVASATPQ
jgi:BASS family bile acid:Na+ symporter